MPAALFIGIGCGLASALLFYSATRGAAALGLALFVLTPLPSAIAGLGWGMPAAVVAGLAGAGAMAAAASPVFAIGFFLAVGVPATLITYLADLGRSRVDRVIDWYPAGHILSALAIYAGLFPILIAPLFGGSYSVLQVPYERFVRQFATQFGQAMTDQQLQAWGNLLVEVTPASIAAYLLVIWVMNAYLAGRIARASGRLQRSWPDLHRLQFPSGTSLLFGAAIIASAASGVPRVIGTALSGGLLIGYALLGLSVVHCISKGRIPWPIWLTYLILLTPLLPYGVIVLALIGLTEPLVRLRQRFARSPPAAPPPTT